MKLGENLTLLTDLYELTMLNGYFKKSENKVAVFDMFFRKNPFGNGYAVMAGLEQVIDYIANMKFGDKEISYLRSLNMFDEDFLEYLKNFKFTGDVYAVEEGRLIFPGEPIVKVIAPIGEAQIIETALLNMINHQSLIATKACRIKLSAGDDRVMEFGLRRAQGPDAGTYGARASIIGGFESTSNVLAGMMFDIPVVGTHAHSWVMSFDSEIEAFETHARLYPQNCILLSDTYNTLKSGVPNAIKIFKELKKEGIELTNYGINLDSGDLAYLSKEARKMLDKEGFTDTRIVVSNELDEEIISSLKLQGAKIDSWGVGTKLITAEGSPSFGGVYKLAAIMKDGEIIPKIKLSENREKITNPGNKKIYRIISKDTGKIKADLITLIDETIDYNEELVLFDPNSPWKRTILKPNSYIAEEILVPIFIKGEKVYKSPSLLSMQERLKMELNTLWDESKRLVNPQPVFVDLSQKLYDLRNKLYFDRSLRRDND